MKLRHGTCHALEDLANEIIEQSLRGRTLCSCYENEPRGCEDCGFTGYRQTGAPVTSRADKSDILTSWKEEDRLNREIFTSTGIADPAVRQGIFRRAWNRARPDLNSRDGAYPPMRRIQAPDYGASDGAYAED